MPDEPKSPDRFAASFHAAARDLAESMGTPAEGEAVQRVSDAVGDFIVWVSPTQLAELGIQAELGFSVVLHGSGVDADRLREAVALADRDEVSSILSELGGVPVE